jgi:hypothetical protein
MRWCYFCCVVLGLGLAGCSSSESNNPAEAPAPKYDPDAVTKAILAAFDKDNSGSLEPGEVNPACPALHQAFAAIDGSRDRKLSAEELRKRVEAYAAVDSGTVSVGCIVTLDGAALEGATVTFVPEACMGEAVKPAVAKTNVVGHCDQFTIDGKPHRGPAPGLYKIQVTKDGATIPARFNTQTTLGREVYPDGRSGEVAVELHLRSR